MKIKHGDELTGIGDEASASDADANRGAEARLRHWLLDHGGTSWSDETFLTRLCEQLQAEGLGLFRVMLALSDAHPQVWGRILTWRDDATIRVINESYESYRNEEYLQGPMPVIHGGAQAIRRRLDGNAVTADFPIVGWLKTQDATDYVAMALLFSDGSRHFMSFTTKRAGGFPPETLSLLDSLMPVIALRVELVHARRFTSTLLRTYVGSHAAKHIEAGKIRRAEGEVIRAIVAFADLRSFTRMTNTLASQDVISVLSHYYEAVAEPLEARGADINKLIGDGMLALFPLESDDPIYTNLLASSVVQGVREAHNRLSAIPASELPAGVEKLRAGFALHVGEVTFGNVGSKSRLDFTVIGPAVNEASRVQLLTKELGRPLLITKAFAGLPCHIQFETVGTHELRGFPEPKEIFALPGF